MLHRELGTVNLRATQLHQLKLYLDIFQTVLQAIEPATSLKEFIIVILEHERNILFRVAPLEQTHRHIRIR